MVRDFVLRGGVAVAVLAAGSATASAAECRNGRSTDPNCYRANGYVCGPCQDDRDDRRGDVEGKRASCEVYARIAVIQADANVRFRCGLQGPAWANDPARHRPVVPICAAASCF